MIWEKMVSSYVDIIGFSFLLFLCVSVRNKAIKKEEKDQIKKEEEEDQTYLRKYTCVSDPSFFIYCPSFTMWSRQIPLP